MDKVGYTPLDMRSLPFDLPLTFNLYIKEGGRYILYREATLPFTKPDRDRLLSNGVDTLWVRASSEYDALSPQQLMMLLELPEEQVPTVAKAGLLYGSATAVARRAISGSLSKETLADVRVLVNATLSYLTNNRGALAALLSVMRNDFSVYTHAVNVAVYSLSLVTITDVTDTREIRQLGVAALLHDVGKAMVPQEILRKPSSLTPEEWTVMRQHPVWGTEMLSKVNDLPGIVTTIVRQHHERLDGSGYPEGIGGEKLHPLSRLVAFVDSYDAMTSDRPYRPAQTPYNALSRLKTEVAGKLDTDVFTSMIQLLGNP